MTEVRDTGNDGEELENRLRCLGIIVKSFNALLREDDNFGALFLIENIKGEYNYSALYASLIVELEEDLDEFEGTESSRAKSSVEELLKYLKTRCLVYSNQQWFFY